MTGPRLRMFTFSLVNVVDGDALGLVAFARGDWRPGELIAPGSLRVVKVIDPRAQGRFPLLLVEPAESPVTPG
jgi:hypothetical protein